MRILIAEDDATARPILDGVLTKWGYEVESVSHGICPDCASKHHPEIKR